MAEMAVGLLLDLLAGVVKELVNLAGGGKTDTAATARDAVKEVQAITKDLKAIQPLLREADRRKHHGGAQPVLTSWVEEVTEAAYAAEDIADDFIYSLAGSGRGGFRESAGGDVAVRHPLEALTWRLREIKPKVKNIRRMRSKLVLRLLSSEDEPGDGAGRRRPWPSDRCCFVDGEDRSVVGFEDDEARLVRWLTEPPQAAAAAAEDPRRMVISVTGMGGLGKTTLVRKVYKSERVAAHFDCRAWVPASPPSGAEEALRTMAGELAAMDEQSMQDDDPATTSGESLPTLLHRLLNGKRYIIVLDDVRRPDFWAEICGVLRTAGVRTSRIILITRDFDLAKNAAAGFEARILPLRFLEQNDALSLFCKQAFCRDPGDCCPDHLSEWARKIADMCEGLPAAIIAVGRLMAFKERTALVWGNFYGGLRSEAAAAGGGMLERMNRILTLCFHDLSYNLKRCFLYCGVFPENHPIRRGRLVRLWVAEGFVEEGTGVAAEDVAEGYADELVSRGLLQAGDAVEAGSKTCRLPAAMREMALIVSEKGKLQAVYRGGAAGSGGPSTGGCGCRVLSVHGQIGAAPPCAADMSHLRSLSVFAGGGVFAVPALRSKLLRVLELSNAQITAIPDQVFDLLNLRYLALRKTTAGKLPGALERLQRLQTLDLRGSNAAEVPGEVAKLRNLRHLLAHDIAAERLQREAAPSGGAALWDLKSLRTLKTVRASRKLAAGLAELKELRSLSVSQVTALQNVDLYRSVRQLDRLRRLSLAAAAGANLRPLEGLPLPPTLQKLRLSGPLSPAPPRGWFRPLRSLTHLHLSGSRLQEDPLPLLSGLPSLAVLELDGAYGGGSLSFAAGELSGLRVLRLSELPSLREVEFEDGALPSLRRLYLCCCPEVKTAPRGVGDLGGLDQLCLRRAAPGLVDELRELKAQRRLKANIKHI